MEAIALDRLSFSYDGETPVLKDISLSIPQAIKRDFKVWLQQIR